METEKKKYGYSIFFEVDASDDELKRIEDAVIASISIITGVSCAIVTDKIEIVD
jgi:hypothetical protein